MNPRMFCLSLLALAVTLLNVSPAPALGFQLGKTKEQLELKYDVTVTDHGTGRVTVSLTIADEGQLKPLTSVDLHIPGKDGSGYSDLSLSLATRKGDGKLTATIHLNKELARQAEIHLKTWTLEGKQLGRTWYYFTIPIAKLIKDEPKKD